MKTIEKNEQIARSAIYWKGDEDEDDNHLYFGSVSVVLYLFLFVVSFC